MYYFNQHERYSSEHLYNAKSIIIKSFSCRVNMRTNELEFKLCSNYNKVFFNKKGMLIETINFFSKNITKYIYTYNSRNKVISVISIDVPSYQLKSIVNLIYDENDRIITEEIFGITFYQDQVVYESEYKHDYTNNTHTIIFSERTSCEFSHIDEYEEWTFIEKLNDCNQVTEIICIGEYEGFHMWSKYHYSNHGELLSETSLFEDGEVYSETLYDVDSVSYRYLKDDLFNGRVWESKYEYNEKGHWIKEYILRNGELVSVIEKTIEYY